MILEGRNLTFSYDQKEGAVFSNVNLQVENHERVAILGPSGFGKTTLCKVLAGYLKPLEGEVLLDGKPLPSKGYCPVQMFCIARALGKDTKFLIADEISTMLDLITQSQIWNFLLKEVKEREIGLLVVSHSEPLLSRIADRRIVF